MPKLFGIEHCLYLAIVFIFFFLLGYALKKNIKDDKNIEYMFRILGFFGLLFIIISRISMSLDRHNFIFLIPDSFCSMTSYLTAISLLFLKKNNILLHVVWLLALVGNICSLIIPDYLADGPTIFFLPTITALMHHSFTLFEIIMVFVFKYMYLTIKKSWSQIILIILYIGLGLILVYGLHASDAFYIKNPAIINTHLRLWEMIPLYISIYLIIMITIELIRRHKTKQETA